jgi:hypothetical protein
MQHSCHPFILDTLEKMEQRRKYIHYNPIDPEIVFFMKDIMLIVVIGITTKIILFFQLKC